MTGKIFRSIMAATVSALIACALIIMGCLYNYFEDVQSRQLADELTFAVNGVEKFGKPYLASLAKGASRLTWIGADGSVLYDTEADPQRMANHAQREEVRQALLVGEGKSYRYSETLWEKNIYCAKRLTDGSVLRISVNTAGIGALALGMLQPIIAVVVLIIILAFLLAKRLAKKIVEPLNQLDLDNPLENKTYDEIVPLLTRINKQRQQIDLQLRQLRQKSDEFMQIIDSMNEGLVLLNSDCVIISINKSAKNIFHAETQQTVGHNFLTVERSPEVTEATNRALQEGHSEICLERNGRKYQIDISSIEFEKTNIGVVLLAFDITEKSNAERVRREFTANVSHELRTPLTAILGSAEMIEGGMVKAYDLPRFVGHIHNEAARLLALLEDIIRLSQLDEGLELAEETVDLAVISKEAVEVLREKAERHNVQLNLQTETCVLRGASRLFYEIVYNLVENAIKYNVDGGSVSIAVTSKGVLTVTDTGIGIAEEHLDRVFERFYRVDKSHSKATGGTGLGLSIVKHAAIYLGAAISLQSKVGEGTNIKVTFKK